MSAEKQVAMKTGQKIFKIYFYQNLPRKISRKVTLHELTITNAKVIKKLLYFVLAPGMNTIRAETFYRLWSDFVCLGVPVCHRETRLFFSFDYTLKTFKVS